MISATIIVALTLTAGAQSGRAVARTIGSTAADAAPIELTATALHALDIFDSGAISGAVVAADSAPELLAMLSSLGVSDQQAVLQTRPDITASLQHDPPGADVVDAWWSALSADARSSLIAGASAIIGNLDGVDWNSRFLANRQNITQAQAGNVATITQLTAQLRSIPLLSVVNASLGTILRQGISALEARNAVYNSMVGRQVMLFDPAGNGRYAEVHGSLTAATENIGVIVNGTTLNMDNVLTYDARAASFWQASRRGGPDSLVTITWMGVDFPDWGTYLRSELLPFATDGAPALARFVTGIDEVSKARITVLGHSAGGVLVGAAEMIGMPADAIVHVESAAAGPGVTSVRDYANPSTPRYTMTSPGDPIRIFQSWGLFGENPADLAGVVVLAVGAGITGSLPIDPSAHDAVFADGSPSWRSMYDVLRGNV